MTLAHQCVLASHCKKAGDAQVCNVTCFPFVLMHGTSGNGGFWATTNVPESYKKCTLENLPIQEDNPKAYSHIVRYCKNLVSNVERGIGLFFYSVPNEENTFGTGTGKTTSAVTILNEYLKRRVIQHATGEKPIKENPVLFIRAADFQNKYNAQFRGTADMKDQASRRFYSLKDQMSKVELLVFDDIGIREITEAFENELTEIVDQRSANKRATIFTSNLSIEGLSKTLGHRIASRIEGMTVDIPFYGKDHRKDGVF